MRNLYYSFDITEIDVLRDVESIVVYDVVKSMGMEALRRAKILEFKKYVADSSTLRDLKYTVRIIRDLNLGTIFCRDESPLNCICMLITKVDSSSNTGTVTAFKKIAISTFKYSLEVV